MEGETAKPRAGGASSDDDKDRAKASPPDEACPRPPPQEQQRPPRHEAGTLEGDEEEDRGKGSVLGRLRRRWGRQRGGPVSLASSAVVDEFMAALRSPPSPAVEGGGPEGHKKRKKVKATCSGVSTNLVREGGHVVAFTSVNNKLIGTGAIVVVTRSQDGTAGRDPEEITQHVALLSWMGELEPEQKKKKKRQPELMLGLTLFEKVGEGDGCYMSQRYFTAPLGYALFTRPSEVKLYEPRANNLGQVHKVGFLSTRSPSLGDAGWKKRWFILTDDYLFFFKTPWSKVDIGRISHEPNNTRLADPALTGRAYCLEISAGAGRMLYLSAPDQATAEGWLAVLRALWPLSAARQEGTLRHHSMLKEMVKGGFLKGSVSLPPAHFASRLAEDESAAATARPTVS